MRLKISVTLIVFYVAINPLFAQIPVRSFSIIGRVIDSLNLTGLSDVKISLQNKLGEMVAIDTTDTSGTFAFLKLNRVDYSIILTGINRIPKTIPVTWKDTRSNILNVGIIALARVDNVLAEVAVTTTRVPVRQEIDRLTYDMSADPESKGSTLLEVMRKVPLLSVDGDDNVLLKGDRNYKILINGRPSSMMERGAKEILRTMPAISVKNIEVIFNPPSKYDAEGIAGIINIITDKKINNGYNGSVSISERFPVGGPGTGFTFTLKQGKFGMSILSGLNSYGSPSAAFQSSRSTSGANATDLHQNGARRSDNRTAYINTDISYEIDSLHLLSVQLSINGSRLRIYNNQNSILSSTSVVLQRYSLLGINRVRGMGHDGAFNYQLGFRSDKARFLTFSYRYIAFGNHQDSELDIFNPVNYPDPDYRQVNNGSAFERTAQADYIHPLGKLTIEGGIKAIMRRNSSDFEYKTFDAATGEFVTDMSRTNRFNNKQNIYAIYNTYTYNRGSWGFRGGIRIEQTAVYADFISTASQVDQNYFNIIPSVNINTKLKNRGSISFSYSQRIQRPGISQLNPFVDRSNPLFETAGNPSLKAALTNLIELNYTRSQKGTVGLSAGYMFYNGQIGQVSAYNHVTSITRTTFENTGRVNVIRTGIYINYPITKKLNSSFNSNIMYGWLNVLVNNIPVQNKGMMGYASLSGSFSVLQGLKMNASLTMNTPYIPSPQGKANGYTNTSLGMNKDIVKDKISFTASVDNPFTKFRNNQEKRIGPDFIMQNDNRTYFRSFSGNLIYRFGKLKGAIKKNTRSISNDDVSN